MVVVRRLAWRFEDAGTCLLDVHLFALRGAEVVDTRSWAGKLGGGGKQNAVIYCTWATTEGAPSSGCGIVLHAG